MIIIIGLPMHRVGGSVLLLSGGIGAWSIDRAAVVAVAAMGSTLQRLGVLVGNVMVSILSYAVFLFLDLLDPVLCVVYKLFDYFLEEEWKPCYCYSVQEDCCRGRRILVDTAEAGKAKIVCHCLANLQLEDISDTLYSRRPLFRELVRSTAFHARRMGMGSFGAGASGSTVLKQAQKLRTAGKSTVRVNSTVVEILQGQQAACTRPRWSDCDCRTCGSWHSSCKETLYVCAQGRGLEPGDGVPEGCSDVLFIHGFISSSTFWTETVFQNFPEGCRSKYRMFAVDLLGFGRSPKPMDSLYTLREHVDRIEHSVLRPHRVESFHVVAHSLGCIIALALAVRFPGAVKSLTLLAPPYFPVPDGADAGQFVLRQFAPRKVWPLIAFGASLASWYEHVSRTVCLLICRHHCLWDFIAKQITRNRTFLIEGFMCHTHHAAWHTLHNVICGAASKMDGYLDMVRLQEDCKVTVLHGSRDELLPATCSLAVKSRIPRAHLKIVEGADHITIVVGRQKAFARELEEIWEGK